MNIPENGEEYVVPYIGTWIETANSLFEDLKYIVVPYIGTWIETGSIRID